ncbi:hypothetical protein ALC57_14153 [Trachymyrmex cornetzi]|uniref:Uncharacterized protein n=1 Tax=Trachymyrmex cornetzi TaxID=471704 RepID=A0A151IYW4_9HYME|nr:hypothetical protein ALC57_14153 [Trachymyrmex cornetzi]
MAMAPTSQNSAEPPVKKTKVEDVTAERQYRIRGLLLSGDHERAPNKERLHSLNSTNQSLTNSHYRIYCRVRCIL